MLSHIFFSLGTIRRQWRRWWRTHRKCAVWPRTRRFRAMYVRFFTLDYARDIDSEHFYCSDGTRGISDGRAGFDSGLIGQVAIGDGIVCVGHRAAAGGRHLSALNQHWTRLSLVGACIYLRAALCNAALDFPLQTALLRVASRGDWSCLSSSSSTPSISPGRGGCAAGDGTGHRGRYRLRAQLGGQCALQQQQSAKNERAKCFSPCKQAGTRERGRGGHLCAGSGD